MQFKTTHHKGLNEILKRVTRNWVLHPFERPENLFLEATPFVLAILMLRRRLREVGGRLITTWEELEASTSLRLDGIGERQPLFRNSCGGEAMSVASLGDRLREFAAQFGMPAMVMS